MEFALKLVDLGKNFPLTTTSRSSTMSTSGNGDSNSSTTINPSSASPGTSTSGMAASKPLRSRTLRYTFRLEEPRLSKSNRVTRTLGSRRVLSVSLPDHLNGSNRVCIKSSYCHHRFSDFMVNCRMWRTFFNENSSFLARCIKRFAQRKPPYIWLRLVTGVN